MKSFQSFFAIAAGLRHRNDISESLISAVITERDRLHEKRRDDNCKAVLASIENTHNRRVLACLQSTSNHSISTLPLLTFTTSWCISAVSVSMRSLNSFTTAVISVFCSTSATSCAVCSEASLCRSALA